MLVRGPACAAIATVVELGWAPAASLSWMSPSKTEWWGQGDREMAACPGPFLDEIRECVRAQLWRSAALVELGVGGEHGVCAVVSAMYLGRLEALNDVVGCNMTLSMAAACTWPPGRVNRLIGAESDDATCPRCGVEGAAAFSPGSALLSKP